MSKGILSVWDTFSAGKRNSIGISLLLVVMGLVWHGGERSFFSKSEGENRSRQQPTQTEMREVTVESEYAKGNFVDRIAMPGMAEEHQSYADRPAVKTHPYSQVQGEPQAIPKPVGPPGWGNAAVRLGLSFFVAMMVASLLRMFVKSMVAVLLVVAAALFLLESQGLIDPFWQKEESKGFFLGAKDWLLVQTQTVRDFVQGSLPSTGAATVGFFLGLRK